MLEPKGLVPDLRRLIVDDSLLLELALRAGHCRCGLEAPFSARKAVVAKLAFRACFGLAEMIGLAGASPVEDI